MQVGDSILATLFHQGELVRINKYNYKVDVLLSGLSCPHGIRAYKQGQWSIADTKNNRVLLLDENFKIFDVVQSNFDWVQDHCHTLKNTILVADANNSKVVEICPITKEVISQFQYSNDWRIYQVSLLLG